MYIYVVYAIEPAFYSPNNYGGSFVFPIGDSIDDEVSEPIDIGFPFHYYGHEVHQVIVSSNGFLVFPGLSCVEDGCCDGLQVTDDDCPSGFIAGLFTDLYDSDGTHIRYRVDGSAPRRVFVVGYTVGNCCDDETYQRFQIRLHETTNVIEVQYENVEPNNDAISCGIQSPDGPFGSQFFYSDDGSNVFSTPRGVRYVPLVDCAARPESSVFCQKLTSTLRYKLDRDRTQPLP